LFVTEAKASQNALEQLHVPRENQIASYYNIREELNMLSKQFQSYLTKPQYIVPFLQPGRLVKVRQDSFVIACSALVQSCPVSTDSVSAVYHGMKKI
jgi:hypothetical protein